jgi:hypothetical protein
VTMPANPYTVPNVAGQPADLQHATVLAFLNQLDQVALTVADTVPDPLARARTQASIDGRRRLLARHAPLRSALVEQGWCSTCPARPFPCPDYRDTVAGMIDGLAR